MKDVLYVKVNYHDGSNSGDEPIKFAIKDEFDNSIMAVDKKGNKMRFSHVKGEQYVSYKKTGYWYAFKSMDAFLKSQGKKIHAS